MTDEIYPVCCTISLPTYVSNSLGESIMNVVLQCNPLKRACKAQMNGRNICVSYKLCSLCHIGYCVLFWIVVHRIERKSLVTQAQSITEICGLEFQKRVPTQGTEITVKVNNFIVCNVHSIFLMIWQFLWPWRLRTVITLHN